MTMQLKDILRPYLVMPDEEKLTFVKHIRHMKYVVKPAVKVRAKKKAAPRAKAKAKKVNTVFAGLSDEQKLALLQELEAE